MTGNAGDIETDTVTATAQDAEQRDVTATDSAVVTILDVAPKIHVVKTATPAARPEPGGTFTFGVTVHNNSVEPVKLLTLVDDVYGDLARRRNVRHRWDDRGRWALHVLVLEGLHGRCRRVADGHCHSHGGRRRGRPTSGDRRGHRDFDQQAAHRRRREDCSPTVANVGDSVTFTITVHNTSFEAVTLTALSDDVYGDLDGRGTCATGGSIAPGATYTCSFSAVVTATETDTVTGHVADNEHTSAHDTASATVTVHPPKVTIVKTADAGSVAPGDAVGFAVTVHNSGSGIARDVTVTDPLPTDTGLVWILDDDAGGACHLAAGSSLRPRDLAPGGSIAFHVTSLTTFATADDSPVSNRACFASTNAGASAPLPDVVVPQPGRSLTLAKTSDAPVETLPAGPTARRSSLDAVRRMRGAVSGYTLTYSVAGGACAVGRPDRRRPGRPRLRAGSATGSADGQRASSPADDADDPDPVVDRRHPRPPVRIGQRTGSPSSPDARTGLAQPLTNTARISSPVRPEPVPSRPQSCLYRRSPARARRSLPPTERHHSRSPAGTGVPGSEPVARPRRRSPSSSSPSSFITPVPARVRRRKG